MLPRILPMLLLGLSLAACATTTPYQPLDKRYGYSERKLEEDRYKVTFAGSSATPRETVENYVLYRAAEITLDHGRDYFLLIDSQTEAKTGSSPGVSLGFGLGGVRFGSRSSVGIGVGTSTGVASSDKTAYTAQAEIVLRSGDKPDDDPQAFDARQLKANLEPLVLRPPLPLR